MKIGIKVSAKCIEMRCFINIWVHCIHFIVASNIAIIEKETRNAIRRDTK